MKRPILAVVACATLVMSAAVAAPASAHGRGERPPITVGDPVTVAEGLFTPLSLEIDRRGTAFLSQDFLGQLTEVGRDGVATTIASASVEGESIGAVSSRHGRVYFVQTSQDHTSSMLMKVSLDDRVREVADLQEHEETANPDQVNTYGFVGITEADPECAAQFDPNVPFFVPPEYTGQLDTNPFATLATKRGVYVADAGGNSILRAKYDGTVSTVAVLPPIGPFLVTAELAAGAGFPECVAGKNYFFEPVPTDIEMGPDGWLYVTSLPGGPEDPSLGARGAVYKVNPHNGKVKFVAGGFVAPTGLAVSEKSGTIFVAELFGGESGTGQISVLRPRSDTPTPLVAASSPAAVELRHGKLWVTTDAFVPDEQGAPQPIGKLTTFELGRGDKGAYSPGDLESYSDTDAPTAEESIGE